MKILKAVEKRNKKQKLKDGNTFIVHRYANVSIYEIYLSLFRIYKKQEKKVTKKQLLFYCTFEYSLQQDDGMGKGWEKFGDGYKCTEDRASRKGEGSAVCLIKRQWITTVFLFLNMYLDTA